MVIAPHSQVLQNMADYMQGIADYPAKESRVGAVVPALIKRQLFADKRRQFERVRHVVAYGCQESQAGFMSTALEVSQALLVFDQFF